MQGTPVPAFSSGKRRNIQIPGIFPTLFLALGIVTGKSGFRY
jgi:hypothetical protein